MVHLAGSAVGDICMEVVEMTSKVMNAQLPHPGPGYYAVMYCAVLHAGAINGACVG